MSESELKDILNYEDTNISFSVRIVVKDGAKSINVKGRNLSKPDRQVALTLHLLDLVLMCAEHDEKLMEAVLVHIESRLGVTIK